MSHKSALVALVAAVCLSLVQAQTKVPVKIFYESLCPDSIRFFKNQLHPVLQTNLTHYMDLNLMPYGKSSQEFNRSSGHWEFQCHHGPNECFGNTIQACAMSILPKEPNESFSRLATTFIDCLMTMVDDDVRKLEPFAYPYEKCAQTNNIPNIVDILKCANDTDGESLLSKLGQLTATFKPELRTYPTIVFENIYQQNEQDLAMTNFRQALCAHIPDRANVKDCNSGAARLQLAIMSLVMVFVTKYAL